MTPDDIINENDSEEQEEEQVENIIDLNNYGMKPYSWRYEGEGGGGGGGGSGGGLVVHGINLMTGEGTFDKTWQEIFDAVSSGRSAVLVGSVEYEGQTYYSVDQITSVQSTPENGYVVNGVFSCASADGYPTNEDDGGGGDEL
jgi:hypothetical protein